MIQGAFCNTFDLHLATICHYGLCFVYFKWPLKTGFTVILFNIYQMYEEWGSALKEAAEDDSVVLAVVTGKFTCLYQ